MSATVYQTEAAALVAVKDELDRQQRLGNNVTTRIIKRDGVFKAMIVFDQRKDGHLTQLPYFI